MDLVSILVRASRSGQRIVRNIPCAGRIRIIYLTASNWLSENIGTVRRWFYVFVPIVLVLLIGR
jgi:hypothetical protein